MPNDVYLVGYAIVLLISMWMSIRLQKAQLLLKLKQMLYWRDFFLSLMASFLFLTIYFFLARFDAEVALFVRLFGLGLIAFSYALILHLGLYVWKLHNWRRLFTWCALLWGEFLVFSPLIISSAWEDSARWGLSVLVVICFMPVLVKAIIVAVQLRVVRFFYWALSGFAIMIGFFLGHCPLMDQNNIWALALTVFAFSFLLSSLYFKRQPFHT